MKMSQSILTTSTDPKIWGPVLWKFLHIMAHNYPENPNPQTKASSRQFFFSLRHLLPCETCRVHYSELLSKRQPETDSSDSLQEWLLWLHNEVSARTNTDAKPWTIFQLKEWLKTNLSSSQKVEQKNKLEVKEQNSQAQHEMQYSPRSTDKNNSLLIAQQMHRRLSKSRQASIVKIDKIEKDVNPTDNQPSRNQQTAAAPQLPHLIREVTDSRTIVKSEIQSHRMQSKHEIAYVPKTAQNIYNTYNRKSMLTRNGRNFLATFRGKFNSSNRGTSRSTVIHHLLQPPVQSNQTNQHTHSETSSSGTKKTCGCKNKK
jgi:hypothetical protein